MVLRMQLAPRVASFLHQAFLGGEMAGSLDIEATYRPRQVLGRDAALRARRHFAREVHHFAVFAIKRRLAEVKTRLPREAQGRRHQCVSAAIWRRSAL